jgi:RNA recognition motif-containing protein
MIGPVGSPHEFVTSVLPELHLSVLGRLPTSEFPAPIPPSLDPRGVERKFISHIRNSEVRRLLYVGNLVSGVGSTDLDALFAAFGSVHCAQVIQDRETGRSKGFGYVEMATEADAMAAVAALHNSDHAGRRLTVHLAKPSEGRGASSTSGIASESESEGGSGGEGRGL